MRRVVAVFFALVLVAAACSNGETSDVGSTVATSSTSTLQVTPTSVALTTTTSLTPTTSAVTTTTTTDVPPTTTALPSTTEATTTGVFYAAPDIAPLPGSGSALGSGCSPGAGPLPDGVWFGNVEARSSTSIEFDLQCMYSGQAAADACSEDGEIPPNDYCTTNVNPTLRMVTVAAETPVHALDDHVNAATVPFVEWPIANQYQACPDPGDLSDYCLVWLYVNDGVVTEIEEMYTP